MGRHASYLKGTAETLRRIANEAEHNYAEAEQVFTKSEDRNVRQDARERADLAAKYPALEGR